MNDEAISIVLSRSEALILFEWIASIDPNVAPPSIGEAEKRVLRSVEGQIESRLVEVLTPDYIELLAAAKRRILEE